MPRSYNRDYSHAYYLKNRARVLAYYQKYYKTHKAQMRSNSKARYQRCKLMPEYLEQRNEYMKAYWKTKKGKRLRKILEKKQRHRSIRRQTRKHQPLDAASVCAICHSKDSLHHHHPDYRSPYEAIILCKRCHIMEHRALKAGTSTIIKQALHITIPNMRQMVHRTQRKV